MFPVVVRLFVCGRCNGGRSDSVCRLSGINQPRKALVTRLEPVTSIKFAKVTELRKQPVCTSCKRVFLEKKAHYCSE